MQESDWICIGLGYIVGIWGGFAFTFLQMIKYIYFPTDDIILLANV